MHVSELRKINPDITEDEIKEFKKRHSDHYLVSCVIEVGNDDD